MRLALIMTHSTVHMCSAVLLKILLVPYQICQHKNSKIQATTLMLLLTYFLLQTTTISGTIALTFVQPETQGYYSLKLITTQLVVQAFQPGLTLLDSGPHKYLVIDLFAQHHRFVVVTCMLSIRISLISNVKNA